MQCDFGFFLCFKVCLFQCLYFVYCSFCVFCEFLNDIVWKFWWQIVLCYGQDIDKEFFICFQGIDLEFVFYCEVDCGVIWIVFGDCNVIVKIQWNVIDVDINGFFEGNFQYVVGDDCVIGW